MSCEDDLHELLNQIDIMVSYRKQEWEEQNQELCTRLQAREAELTHSRCQIRNLQRQAEETEQSQRETVCGYEDRVASLRSELQKLKDSYDRLQSQHRREEVCAALGKESSFESSALSRRLEESTVAQHGGSVLLYDELQEMENEKQEFQVKSREWEKQTSMHQRDLAALEVNRKLLAAKCKLFKLESGCYQSPLTEKQRVEKHNEATELQVQPEASHEVAQVNVVIAAQPRGVPASQRDIFVEKECVPPEVHALLQETRVEVHKLKSELQAIGDQFQTAQLEEKRWKREAARLSEQLSAQEIFTRLKTEKERVMAADLQDLRETVERVQHQLESSHQQEELLRGDIIQLKLGLESSNSQTKQLKDLLGKKEKMLSGLEHAGKRKDNEIVMLKERLMQLQAERSKMEAMRVETLNLQSQLRDSENAVASANQKAAQFQKEFQSIMGKAANDQVAKIQLEALRLENKNLKQLISDMESNATKILKPVGDTPASNGICDVSSDSGQWEEDCQPGDMSCLTEEPHRISHVSPQPGSWEQTVATDYPLAQSPTPKPEHYHYPHGNSHREEDFTAKVDRMKNMLAPLEPLVLKAPSPVFITGEQFLEEEEHRMERLARHFDSYIQELHTETQKTLLKYGISHSQESRSC